MSDADKTSSRLLTEHPLYSLLTPTQFVVVPSFVNTLPETPSNIKSLPIPLPSDRLYKYKPTDANLFELQPENDIGLNLNLVDIQAWNENLDTTKLAATSIQVPPADQEILYSKDGDEIVTFLKKTEYLVHEEKGPEQNKPVQTKAQPVVEDLDKPISRSDAIKEIKKTFEAAEAWKPTDDVESVYDILPWDETDLVEVSTALKIPENSLLRLFTVEANHIAVVINEVGDKWKVCGQVGGPLTGLFDNNSKLVWVTSGDKCHLVVPTHTYRPKRNVRMSCVNYPKEILFTEGGDDAEV